MVEENLRIYQIFKIRKIRNNVIRDKMNIKNSVLDYKIQTVKLIWPRAKDGPRKAP